MGIENPLGIVAAPVWGDEASFNRWTAWVNMSATFTQQGIIREVHHAYCVVSPLRNLNAKLHCAIPPMFRGSGLFTVDCVVTFKNLVGGSDVGTEHILEYCDCGAVYPTTTPEPTTTQPPRTTITPTTPVPTTPDPEEIYCCDGVTPISKSLSADLVSIYDDESAGCPGNSTLTWNESGNYWEGPYPKPAHVAADWKLRVWCDGVTMKWAQLENDVMVGSGTAVDSLGCNPFSASIHYYEGGALLCCGGIEEVTITITESLCPGGLFNCGWIAGSSAQRNGTVSASLISASMFGRTGLRCMWPR